MGVLSLPHTFAGKMLGMRCNVGARAESQGQASGALDSAVENTENDESVFMLVDLVDNDVRRND